MNMTLQCPKCRGTMRTHLRQNIPIEQCDNCRGIFLDYGELEALNQLQAQWTQPMPPPPAQPMPGHAPWGAPPPYQQHGHPYPYKKKGMMGMLFSS